MRQIVCIAGGIGSGKSELAARLGEVLRCPIVGFGQYVRSVARAQNLPETREVLQRLGGSLAAEGWESFCLAVLRQASWETADTLIVEGIRHREAIEGLRSVAKPAAVSLVYLRASEATRDSRVALRDGNIDGLAGARTHSTEAQVDDLWRIADLVVNADREADVILGEVRAWLDAGRV
jgi:dephospho-CoA kinase